MRRHYDGPGEKQEMAEEITNKKASVPKPENQNALLIFKWVMIRPNISAVKSCLILPNVRIRKQPKQIWRQITKYNEYSKNISGILFFQPLGCKNSKIMLFKM